MEPLPSMTFTQECTGNQAFGEHMFAHLLTRSMLLACGALLFPAIKYAMKENNYFSYFNTSTSASEWPFVGLNCVPQPASIVVHNIIKLTMSPSGSDAISAFSVGPILGYISTTPMISFLFI
jgi:hypothetical protein